MYLVSTRNRPYLVVSIDDLIQQRNTYSDNSYTVSVDKWNPATASFFPVKEWDERICWPTDQWPAPPSFTAMAEGHSNG